MSWLDLTIATNAKTISKISTTLGIGAGATWPGEIALRFKPDILSSLLGGLRKGIIIVAGTNGKTTTSLMITTILEAQGLKVIHNASGANLLNGVVSSLINKADWQGKTDADWGVFEVDENALEGVMSNVKCQMSNGKQKLIVVLLNLFRDQLDRYGEVDVIAEKWERALREQDQQHEQHKKDSNAKMIRAIQIVANADDPLIVSLSEVVASRPGLEAGVRYFGLDDPSQFQKNMDHATDSIFCLNCSTRLQYEGVYYSHIGIWKCPTCGEKRPTPDIQSAVSPLPGLYNMYNTLAAVTVAQTLDIKQDTIRKALLGFLPAFGRQEKIGDVTIFLSKNPAGFNESLRTVIELQAESILLALNDRIPDGRDVSWIWDVDFEMIPQTITIYVTGDRALDMAVRLKYGEHSAKIVSTIPKVPNLYILATYSAMLDIRKQLIGKKIL